MFAAKLYKLTSVSGKYVNDIINDVSDLFVCHTISVQNEFKNQADIFSKSSFTVPRGNGKMATSNKEWPKF